MHSPVSLEDVFEVEVWGQTAGTAAASTTASMVPGASNTSTSPVRLDPLPVPASLVFPATLPLESLGPSPDQELEAIKWEIGCLQEQNRWLQLQATLGICSGLPGQRRS